MHMSAVLCRYCITLLVLVFNSIKYLMTICTIRTYICMYICVCALYWVVDYMYVEYMYVSILLTVTHPPAWN